MVRGFVVDEWICRRDQNEHSSGRVQRYLSLEGISTQEMSMSTRYSKDKYWYSRCVITDGTVMCRVEMVT